MIKAWRRLRHRWKMWRSPSYRYSYAAETGTREAYLRGLGAQERAAGRPTHAMQDADGTWYDLPCDCPGGHR